MNFLDEATRLVSLQRLLADLLVALPSDFDPALVHRLNEGVGDVNLLVQQQAEANQDAPMLSPPRLQRAEEEDRACMLPPPPQSFPNDAGSAMEVSTIREPSSSSSVASSVTDVETLPSSTVNLASLAAEKCKERAAAMFTAKEFAAALALCDEAVALEPNEATHRANRSLAHLRLGDCAKAAEDAQAAVGLRPEWGRARYRLGCALQAAGDYEGAEAALRASLARDPGSDIARKALKEVHTSVESAMAADAEARQQHERERVRAEQVAARATAAAAAEAKAAVTEASMVRELERKRMVAVKQRDQRKAEAQKRLDAEVLAAADAATQARAVAALSEGSRRAAEASRWATDNEAGAEVAKVRAEAEAAAILATAEIGAAQVFFHSFFYGCVLGNADSVILTTGGAQDTRPKTHCIRRES